MHKRIIAAISVFLSVLLLFSFAAVGACALEAPSTERVGAAFLFNLENEKEIFAYEADTVKYPSAAVKIMTSVVAYEALRDRMDEKITVTREMIAESRGNYIAIEAGERISVRDLRVSTYGVRLDRGFRFRDEPPCKRAWDELHPLHKPDGYARRGNAYDGTRSGKGCPTVLLIPGASFDVKHTEAHDRGYGRLHGEKYIHAKRVYIQA